MGAIVAPNGDINIAGGNVNLNGSVIAQGGNVAVQTLGTSSLTQSASTILTGNAVTLTTANLIENGYVAAVSGALNVQATAGNTLNVTMGTSSLLAASGNVIFNNTAQGAINVNYDGSTGTQNGSIMSNSGTVTFNGGSNPVNVYADLIQGSTSGSTGSPSPTISSAITLSNGSSFGGLSSANPLVLWAPTLGVIGDIVVNNGAALTLIGSSGIAQSAGNISAALLNVITTAGSAGTVVSNNGGDLNLLYMATRKPI